jgi:hypothetical protein
VPNERESGFAAGIVRRGTEVRWLFADPTHETLDVGMGGERFEGVVFALQSLFVA